MIYMQLIVSFKEKISKNQSRVESRTLSTLQELRSLFHAMDHYAVKLFASFTVIHLTAWHDVLCNLPHKFGIVGGDKLPFFLFFHQILRCLRMRHVDE